MGVILEFTHANELQLLALLASAAVLLILAGSLRLPYPILLVLAGSCWASDPASPR